MFKKVKTKSILEIDCNAIEPNFTEYEKSLIKLIKDCNYKESIRRINVITEYFKQNPKELQEASVYESLSDSVISDFKWDYCIQFDINGENYYVKSQQYEDLTKDKICWFDFKGYDIYKYYYNSEMPFEKIIVEHKVNHNN